MKTNLFKFLKLKRNKIVLEEEIIDSPFLLFLNRYKKYIILLLFLLALIAIIIGVYFAVINIRETSKIVTNINQVVVDFEGDNKINSINMKPISGGQAIKEFYERYGNIGLTEGVIFEIKVVPYNEGIITFYSDGSAKIINNEGIITRVSALENGDFGVKENGNIIIGAKTKIIAIEETKTLEDGTTIIYYSDNSCEIIIPNKNVKMLVRNSRRLVIENNRLKTINPSGVSKKLNEDNQKGHKITYYEDGTIKIEKGNETFIIRNKEDIDFSNFTYPNNNQATIVETKDLKDGSKIIYYTDGSAEIIKNNESIMVRQSKDIIYTDERVIEIVETKYAKESLNKKTPQNKEIIYLTNAGALIKNPNGTYEYVYENSDIKYDNNGNIKNDVETIKEKFHKTTPNGTIIINLEDGNSVIIDENGYRVVKTSSIVYDKDTNIKGIEGEIEIDSSDQSVTENNFVIENIGSDNVRYMITIEVSDNHEKYAPIKLDPMYLRYNIVVESDYLENKPFDNLLEKGTAFEGDVVITKETYVLYEGKLSSGASAKVNLGMWIDYDDIPNDYQNSVFVGTIKVYSETIKKDAEK